MNKQDDIFFKDDSIAWQDLGKGVQRKVLGYTPEMMLVKVRFETGAVGELHHHPHVQTSYVSSGKFSYSIDGKDQILSQGDGCVVPSNLVHGCVCLEAGELIDTFTPFRADFI
ncbi:cupin domain-containing protein [Sphingobacterium alkalisoli]|uniref:Cupin domain-containing protein n=1 Tax=Sphingobacterium alkalisoli TaxID=1874115 RepID=A0A4U0H3F8_9SPHI|nr:cupin domain-containing protein [Sphingobacterium alkalisoli]TJY65664.1 cupin domain-containing protein [Sphingobacterium alkalisoli]